MIRAISLAAFVMSAACSDGDGAAAGQVTTRLSKIDTTTVAENPAKATVLRARAFDRADNLDSARILYEEGARKAPAIKDWLLLRAAGVTRDKSARDTYLGDVDPGYFERTVQYPRWLVRVVPGEMTTWRGGGWSRFYTE